MTSSRLCGQLSGWPLLIIFALACSGRTDEPDPGGGSGGVHYDGGAPGAGGRMSGGQPGSGGDGGDESGGNDAGPDDGGAPPASSGGASSGGSSDGSGGEDESGGLSGTGGDATTSAYTVCDEELGEENNPLCGSAMICRSGYCTPGCENNVIDDLIGTGEDCPVPTTGDAQLSCGLSYCHLRCPDGKTCPDELVCQVGATLGTEICVSPAVAEP